MKPINVNKKGRFQVWLVRDAGGERFCGGPIDNPFGNRVVGLYRTETDAKSSDVARKAVYEDVVAWLCTFIVLLHGAGDAKYHVEATRGGRLAWNDDRDVMAVFETEEEARAWAESPTVGY